MSFVGCKVELNDVWWFLFDKWLVMFIGLDGMGKFCFVL